MSEEEQRAAVQDYENALAEYKNASIQESESGNIRESQREEELKKARYDAMKYRMASEGDLKDFAKNIDEIEQIIEQTPALCAMEEGERLRTAYYIARGKAEPQELSDEELVEKIKQNPQVMRILEAELIERVSNTENPPAFSASVGRASMPATIKQKPKTIDEASNLAKEAFGLN